MEDMVLGPGSPGGVYAFYTDLPALDSRVEIHFSETKAQIFQLPTKCPASQNRQGLSSTFRVGQGI